jgi:hypothetical protein
MEQLVMPPPVPRIAMTALLAGWLRSFAGASPAYRRVYLRPTERPISSGAACYGRDSNERRIWGHAT